MYIYIYIYIYLCVRVFVCVCGYITIHPSKVLSITEGYILIFTVAFPVELGCFLNKLAFNIQRKPRVTMSALVFINM